MNEKRSLGVAVDAAKTPRETNTPFYHNHCHGVKYAQDSLERFGVTDLHPDNFVEPQELV